MGTTASCLGETVGPSGFSSNSTAEDVTANLDLSSKTVIVTGATAGIGKECARVLAQRGAHVVLAVRNVKLGETVCEEIHSETPAARLDVINNAGLLQMKFHLSEDGVEKTFAVNHLGHFLLTDLLLDIMKATAKDSGQEGRIVNVSSFGHNMTYRNHDLNQIGNPKRFVGFQAYGQSKLANILHAKELSRRLQEEGANVTANALHPGTVDTALSKNELSAKIYTGIYLALARKYVKTVPQLLRPAMWPQIPTSKESLESISLIAMSICQSSLLLVTCNLQPLIGSSVRSLLRPRTERKCLNLTKPLDLVFSMLLNFFSELFCALEFGQNFDHQRQSATPYWPCVVSRAHYLMMVSLPPIGWRCSS